MQKKLTTIIGVEKNMRVAERSADACKRKWANGCLEGQQAVFGSHMAGIRCLNSMGRWPSLKNVPQIDVLMDGWIDGCIDACMDR